MFVSAAPILILGTKLKRGVWFTLHHAPKCPHKIALILSHMHLWLDVAPKVRILTHIIVSKPAGLPWACLN